MLTDHAGLLAAVVTAAEQLARPRMGGAGADLADLAQLRARLAAAAMPVDGTVLIDAWDITTLDAVIMAARAQAEGEEAKATEWAQVVGVMLPKVREHIGAALAWRRDTRPSA